MARIAVAGFLHETNTFASPTRYGDFASRPSGLGFLRGPALEPFATIPRGTGGFVTAALDAGHAIVPLMWCSAEPGGIVTSDAFERVMAEMLDRLAAALPFDALYLDIHGAMVAERYDDGEAEILRRVRAIVGEAMPLATSLDLHGNIGAGMVAGADAMVAYRTYPHVDMRETGARAFALIERLLARGKLAKARRALPFLMPIHRQSTYTEPCRAIYAELARIEASDPRIASLSLLPGFPMADVPMCGPVVLAYADDQARADAAADALTAFIAAREAEFAPHLKTPEEAIAAAASAPAGKPVIFADVQDNSGAGGTSDTTGILEALVRAKVPDAIVAIVFDAESVAKAHAAGEGAEVTLDLGGKLVAGQRPYHAAFKVEKLIEGPFKLTGPMGKGLNADLGKVARLAIGGVRVVVSSKRTQCLDQAYFRCVGLEPADHRIVVVKSSNHYRADFQPIAGAVFDVAAPAVYDVNPANLAWRKLPRGLRLYGGGPAVK
jgi:microcystin degradation protein MlrC